MKALKFLIKPLFTAILFLFIKTASGQTDCPMGILNTDFNPGQGPDGEVFRALAQPDGKILICGRFSQYRGISRKGIARINADGTLDESFNPGNGFSVGYSANALAIQSDGKILVGGNFTDYNSVATKQIIRLNANGDLDNSFSIGSGLAGINQDCKQLLLQPDGKVIATGSFSQVNGVSRSGIVRLNANGSLDSGFNPGSGFAFYDAGGFSIQYQGPAKNGLALQPDGRILVGGDFASFDGRSRNKIIRLNSNGTIDTTFNPGTGFDNDVEAVAVKSNGKILAGGQFTSFNGVVRDRIAQLNANGTLDTGFDPLSGLNGTVRHILLQPDNKAILLGDFKNYNGFASGNLCRVKISGEPDFSFTTGPGFDWGYPNGGIITSDGLVLAYGSFSKLRGTDRNNMAKIGLNLTIESVSPSGPYCSGQTISVSYLAGAGCFQAGNVFRVQLCPGTGFGSPVTIGTLTSSTSGTISCTLPQNISGSYRLRLVSSSPAITGEAISSNNLLTVNQTGVNIQTSPGFAIIPGTQVTFTATPLNGGNSPVYEWFRNNSPVGINSSSFTTTSLANRDSVWVRMTGNACSPGGKVVSNKVVMYVNSNPEPFCLGGNADPGFQTGTGPNGDVYAIARQANGKFIIGGNFTEINGTSRNRIARLNADGSLDISFNPGIGFDFTVNTLAIQGDGKIMVAGSFNTFNGTGRNYIVRLDSSGAFDNSFNLGSGFNGTVNQIILTSDQKVVAGGLFSSYRGISCGGLVRINPDGTFDDSYNTGSGINNGGFSYYISRNGLAVQKDGKILAAGWFPKYNGLARNSIVRINPDGSLDPTFNPGTGPADGNGNLTSQSISAIVLQPDGKVIAGGDFSTFSGEIRNNIVRLNTDGTLDPDFNPVSGFNNTVTCLALQSDGKVIAGGQFSNYYNGSTTNRICRINRNGSLDGGFDSFEGLNNSPYGLLLLPDNRLLAAGSFTQLNGSGTPYIVRFRLGVGITSVSPAGPYCPGQTIQVSFGAGTDCFNPGNVFSLQLSPDDGFGSPITLGTLTSRSSGTFSVTLPASVSGSDYRLRVVSSSPALVSNGSGYLSRISIRNLAVNVLVNPGYLVAANQPVTFSAVAYGAGNSPSFTWYRNGSPSGSNSNYTLASPGNGDTIYVRMTSPLCGTGTGINSVKVGLRVGSNTTNCLSGALESGITGGTGFNGKINFIAEGPDGKILTGGDFTSINGTTAGRFALLNPDGTPDPDFQNDPGCNSSVTTVCVQPDGKILLGGNFNNCNGFSRSGIIRLNSNGQPDPAFSMGTGFNSTVTKIIFWKNKIYVSGQFTSFNGIAVKNLVRLNTDGTLDQTLKQAITLNGLPEYDGMDIQNDGKVVLGGNFTTSNGLTQNRIIRLFADGSPDPSFQTGTGFDGTVVSVLCLPDGKILAAGPFSSYNGSIARGIARINGDGSLDTTFQPGDGFTPAVEKIRILPDNDFVATGSFTQFNSQPAGYLKSFRYNGNAGASFLSGSGLNDGGTALCVLSNGNVAVGGSFTQVQGVSSPYFALLKPRNIRVTSISPQGPFCQGQQVTINFTTGSASTCFQSGNVFTAQLSNASGSFDNPVNLGSIAGTGGSSSLTVTLPAGSGSGYRIRIASSAPAVNGSETSATFTLSNLSPPVITSTTPGSTCGPGPAKLKATANSGASVQWFSVPSGGTLLFTGTDFTTPTVSSPTTFYAQATNSACPASGRTPVQVSVYPRPSLTLVKGDTLCQTGTFVLKAKTSLGAVLWFRPSDTLNPVWSDTVFAINASGAQPFYRVEGFTISNGCRSRPDTAYAVKLGLPQITSFQDGIRCNPGLFTLSATPSRGTVYWYEQETGGSPVGTGNTFTITLSASKTYYAGVVADSCISTQRQAVKALLANPSVVSVTPGTRCGPGSVTLSAQTNAGSIRWYSSANGGTPLATGSTYTASVTQSTIFYAEAFESTCTSASRTPVQAGVYTSVPTLTANPVSRCNPGSVVLNATPSPSSAKVRWYSGPNGGTPLDTGNSFTIPFLNQTSTYYADAIDSVCISTSRISVVATVVKPVLNQGTPNPTRCNPGPINLTASAPAGTGIIWYHKPFPSDSIAGTGSPLTVTVNQTRKFYVAAFLGTCTSNVRTEVTATVQKPGIQSVTGSSSCTPGSFNLLAQPEPGSSLRWFKDSTGGTPVGTGNIINTGFINATDSWFVEAYTGTCINPIRQRVTARIIETPVISSTTPGRRCGYGYVTLSATPSAGIVRWYSSNVGGTSISNQSVESFYVGTYGTTLFWAEAFLEGCPPPQNRVQVEANIEQLPAITQTVPAQRCGDGQVTLKATPSPGASVRWFDSDTDTVPLHQGTDYLTPFLSDTRFYFAEARSQYCTSENRTPVKARIRRGPAIVVQPASDTTCVGNNLTFNVVATGDSLTYKWFKNNNDINVAYPELNLNDIPISDNQTKYRVSVNSAACPGPVSSSTATLTVRFSQRSRLQAFPQQTLCIGDTVELEALNQIPGAVYKWYQDGFLIGSSTSPRLYVTTSGNYHYTGVYGSCTSNSWDVAPLSFSSDRRPAKPLIEFAGTAPTICNAAYTLKVASPGNSQSVFIWRNNSGIIAQGPGLTSLGIPGIYGNFWVTADSSGCQNTSAAFSATPPSQSFSNPRINYVTVERVPGDTTRCRVIWARNSPPDPDVLHTVVYRQGAVQGVFDSIGVVPNTDTSFLDMVALPSQRAQFYKIAARAACQQGQSYLTPLSQTHKSVHLIIIRPNQTVTSYNLLWNPYEGFNVASYRILRGTSATNLNLLSTVPGNITSFTDDPGPGVFFYSIEAVANPLDLYVPWGRISAVIRKSKSNTRPTTQSTIDTISSNVLNDSLDPGDPITTILEVKEEGLQFVVKPNPFSTRIWIKGGIEGSSYRVKIRDAWGRELVQEVLPGNREMEFYPLLPSGIYWLEVSGNAFRRGIRLIKQ